MKQHEVYNKTSLEKIFWFNKDLLSTSFKNHRKPLNHGTLNSPVKVSLLLTWKTTLNSTTVRQPEHSKNKSLTAHHHLSHIKTPNCHQRQSVCAGSISEFLSTSRSLFPPLDSLLSLLHWWLLHSSTRCTLTPTLSSVYHALVMVCATALSVEVPPHELILDMQAFCMFFDPTLESQIS